MATQDYTLKFTRYKMNAIIAIICVFISSIGFSQPQINGAQIKNKSISQIKLADDALRPTNGGTLSDFALVFGPAYRKKFNLSVTSDISFTLAPSGQTADSYIFISTIPDGTHVISFPSNWVIKSGSFDPLKTQRIELYYDGATVYADIFNSADIVISTLISAAMIEGTDDLILTFDNPVNVTTAGWTVTASGGAATVTAVVSGSGTAIIDLDLSRNIASGETMTVSYNPGTGNTLSLTGNEIPVISNFIVDTGDAPEPENVITVGPTGRDYTTIQAGSDAAVAGQTVLIDGGTYRETIVAKSGVTYQNRSGETVVVSGLNLIGTTGWTSHDLTEGKSIYKKTISLPVNGFAQNLTSNTTILANQIFKDGVMQIQARWPNISTPEDMIDRTKYRHFSQMQSFGYSSLTDSGLPAGNFNGAHIWVTGWFISESRQITGHSGTTLTYPTLRAQNGTKFQRWYYITNDLELLDAAKEWHYDGTTLYYWQTGGGTPSGTLEYKARNWGFDLRGKTDVKIIGLTFIGCEPATGDGGTNNTVIDNIRASYTNHAFLTTPANAFNYFNANQTGIKLLGTNNTVKNSEFRHVSSQVIWAGEGTTVQNNLCYNIGWEGNYGAFVSPWGSSAGNIKVLNNTAYNLGRSAIDWGTGTHLNNQVSYNYFHTFSKVTSDVGVIYGCCGVNITGTVIDHNWLANNTVQQDYLLKHNGVDWYDGIHVNLYYDQGTGTTTVHHNVMWLGGVNDVYTEITHNGGNARNQWFYNNTFATTAGRETYFTPTANPSDIQRNNIYRHDVNINWQIADSNTNGSEPGDVENSLFKASNPLFVGGSSDGLQFRLQSGSPARNIGAVIAGITDNDDGTPDAGAYVFGGTDWVPGYSEAAPDEFVLLEDNNAAFTTYSGVKTTFSNATFSGGTATFFNTVDDFMTVNITGTEFEWYAEKYNHAGIVEVKVDGVVQDCDPGTGGTQNCDLYQNTTTNNSSLIFSKTGLSAGAHTLTFTIKSKNASSTGYYLNHDVIKVTP